MKFDLPGKVLHFVTRIYARSIKVNISDGDFVSTGGCVDRNSPRLTAHDTVPVVKHHG